jgi:phosphoribosylformimino-5-aminoimidazole carboxamide ribotide isomerase
MLVLPAIDILSGKCVRLFQGDYNKETVYSDSPADMGKRWEKGGAKYIHLVDLDGAKQGKPVNIDSIQQICSAVSVPCELGGGIRTIEDADIVFNIGVSRIILGTAACDNESLVADLMLKYGSDKIVIGIDAKNGKVAIKGWLENSGIGAIELASKFAKQEVKRFIYTDIARDGALIGPNFKAITEFCDAVPRCKVIASGGVGSIEHVKKMRAMSDKKTNLEGIIIGKALYDGKIDLANGGVGDITRTCCNTKA